MKIPTNVRLIAGQMIEGYEGLGGYNPTAKKYFLYQGSADRKGVLTIGRGHVASRYEKDTNKFANGLTLAEVDKLFEQDLQPRYDRLSGKFEGETDQQMAVILSSGYNYEAMWNSDMTPGRCMNRKDWKGVARGLLMYTMSNGRHQLGLWRRRMTEALCFLTGEVYIAKSASTEAVLFAKLKAHIPDLQAIRNKKFRA